MQNTEKIPRKKIAQDGCYVNLSGLENMAGKLYRESGDAKLTAAFVFDFLSRALAAMAASFREQYGDLPLLFAGGVMSNRLLQTALAHQFSDVAFATPALSADNAVGTALLTRLATV